MNDKVTVQLTKTEVAAIFTALDYAHEKRFGYSVEADENAREDIFDMLDGIGVTSVGGVIEGQAKRFAELFENGGVDCVVCTNDRTMNEITTLLLDYVGESGISESAVDVLGRLLGELEGYRRNVLAADIRLYIRAGHAADALSFAITMQPRYDNVPGAVIQRIMNEITKEDDNNR